MTLWGSDWIDDNKLDDFLILQVVLNLITICIIKLKSPDGALRNCCHLGSSNMPDEELDCKTGHVYWPDFFRPFDDIRR